VEELRGRYGDYFEGGMGAEAIARLIDRLDLDEEELKLRENIEPTDGRRPLSAQRKQKAIKRLKIVSGSTVATRPVGGSTTRGP